MENLSETNQRQRAACSDSAPGGLFRVGLERVRRVDRVGFAWLRLVQGGVRLAEGLFRWFGLV